ncbi:MAG TPA: peptidase M6 [Bacteroidales bacterium]|nr:peptidase M6 [Bacteroidales bacterium]
MKKTGITISLLALLAVVLVAFGQSGKKDQLLYSPIDPQVVQDQDNMTWNDYRPIPGKNWADPALKPEREFRMALVAVDFSDQPFVMTLPQGSDPFGNPQIGPVRREEIPQFYADFWLKPSAVNHGQTINGYWMEQSRGKFGITQLEAFGPYRMPRPLWAYGLNEHKQNNSTPDGSTARYRMERDIDSLWRADRGNIKDNYDAILRVYAGYDETGVWQEFGEMMFNSREEIPPEWGNPNPAMQRWVPTRYVEWTSWKAGQMMWGLSSIRQGENSGTITHELGHFAFRIGDNNNNPYIQPYRRVGSGTWDMMDRGSFNGPGGPHMRWVVPPIAGASMPAGLMIRNRLVNGFITENDLITVSREGLGSSGPVIARITARAVEPLPGEYAGMVVRLDGAEPHDRTPATDPATDPLSPGTPRFNYYSLEVVQRIGYDSFCPDNGVLLALNTDEEGRNGGPNQFNCFNWVIDAHPEDINMVDYVKPNGEKVMRTVADYRQLNDALFHAGLNSGSEFEYTDVHNRLHFYVLDIHRNDQEITSYTVGVRSLDSEITRVPVIVTAPKPALKISGEGTVEFTLSGDDICRLSAEVQGKGWEVKLFNELAAPADGKKVTLPVYLKASPGCSKKATVTLTAVSESDPDKISQAVAMVRL